MLAPTKPLERAPPAFIDEDEEEEEEEHRDRERGL